MEFNWLAVVIATVVGMAVAGTWRGVVFATLWSTLTGVAAAESAQASRRKRGASTLLQHNAFELKPARLTVLNSAYQLLVFLGVALTIGLV